MSDLANHHAELSEDISQFREDLQKYTVASLDLQNILEFEERAVENGMLLLK